MSEKTWRINDKETFCDRAIEYMIPMISNFMTDKKFKLPTDKQKKIDNIMNGITEERVMSTNIEVKMQVIKEIFTILLEDVDDWTQFSLNPDSSLDDIMLRAMIGIIFGSNFMCYTYICTSNKNLTEEFLRDINYLNSGLFKFGEFDDDHVNTVNKYFEIEDLDISQDPDFRRLYKFDKKGNIKKHGYYTNFITNQSKKTPLSFPRLDYKRLSFPDLAKKYPVIYDQYSYAGMYEDME